VRRKLRPDVIITTTPQRVAAMKKTRWAIVLTTAVVAITYARDRTKGDDDVGAATTADRDGESLLSA